MKRLILFVVMLCLCMAGCGAVPAGSVELPEGIGDCDDAARGWYGTSFSALRERVQEDAMLDHWTCLIWQETDPSGGLSTYAAVTENGVSVTGLLKFCPGDGIGFRLGIAPIPPVEDPEALAGLTAELLTERFGPCHFDLGSGLWIPCWFTEDGKLLIGHPVGVSLQDLLSGEEVLGDPLTLMGEGTVAVDWNEIPTKLVNDGRWEAFLARTAQGAPDEICLRLSYQESRDYVLTLRYDGERYYLSDEGTETAYRYLLIEEETNPPATARFHTAVHYLLSDDPDMTYTRYFFHMVSSALVLDFPNTRQLFAVYDDGLDPS